MRAWIGFSVAALAAGEVIPVPAGGNAEGLKEITVAIRRVGGVRQVTVDAEKNAVAVNGTPEQIALARWLAGRIAGSVETPREYRAPEGDVVRVFAARDAADRGVQEIATVIRMMTGVPGLAVVLHSGRAFAVRGTAEQAELAEWLAARLPAPEAGSEGPEQRPAPGAEGEAVRLFRLAHSASAQDLQEIATIVRTIAEAERVFTYTPQPVVAVRAMPAQIALAEWLITELDKPAGEQAAGSHESRPVDAAGGEAVRVFYLAGAVTPRSLQETAHTVRTAAGASRLFTNSARNALVVRGTPEQLATAERLIETR